MTEKEFCKLYNSFCGSDIDNPKQLTKHVFNGEELKEFLEHVVESLSLPRVNDRFKMANEKRNSFIEKFKNLLAEYDAEIELEDFGRDYMPDERMVVTFEWDNYLYDNTGSGFIDKWIIGGYENGR